MNPHAKSVLPTPNMVCARNPAKRILQLAPNGQIRPVQIDTSAKTDVLADQ